MRVLVTGANGYIGQGLVKRLLEDGCAVVATDVCTDRIDPEAERIAADLFSVEDPKALFGAVDACFHLAWRNGFVHNDRSHLTELPLHYAFLSRLAEQGLMQLAVMGSMHEVGFFEGSIKADTPCRPQSLYGIAKNALREATALLCKERGICFQWVRGFYIVGNIESGSSVFSKLVAAEKRGEAEFPFTMGQNQWDFIDYDSFTEMLAAIIEQKEYAGIINACSGYPEKLADRMERFLREEKLSIRLKYGAFPDRPYDSKAVWGDDRIIREILEKRRKGSAEGNDGK